LRQQQAVKLAEAGMDVEEIAKKLGSDVETVNKWIG
jgi:transposase